jgi:hypothetical protein
MYTPLGTENNYRAIANLQNSQITTAPAKPFLSLLCLRQPLPGNGFYHWRFFHFKRSDPISTAVRAELNSQLTTNN